MEILLISYEDKCRTRIAQELLSSYGRGMRITTCGIAEADSVPGIVVDFMSQKGYEISKKKPSSISDQTQLEWDFVISLCKESSDELKMLNLKYTKRVDFEFLDAFDELHLQHEEQLEKLDVLYQDMNHSLYELYRDVLSEMLLPRCTCGANTYCRCE